ncbi:MAG: UDP-glucose/GDP-mannose dehydrogenase family protein [Deltaproteobacteria bacterium]|nr:UDP-glucose/GDP-mannose dehydrogenase family protein [Deltaproteobacteria bacterium]
MRIAVIGTGYVGLVTGACFADFGNDVIAVELDPARLARLEAGEVPIYEPGLEVILRSNREAGRYRFSQDLEQAVCDSDVVFVALRVDVGSDWIPVLDKVLEVADRIGKALVSCPGDFKVIATRATVPVGTTDRLAVRIGAHVSLAPGRAAAFAVVSNPSFLKEGNAVEDFTRPDSVLIGTGDARAAEIMRRLYSPLTRTRDVIFITDARSAELSKYATSALLASRVSFMNDLAMLAEDLGADIEVVRRVLGEDPRIGPKYLFVGPGFGGRLLHNDLRALLHAAREAGRDLAIVRATDEINQRQKRVLSEKLERTLHGVEGKTVAVWGAAFKPMTADLGEAPALALIDRILALGGKVQAHDPHALENLRAHYGDRISYASTMYEAVTGAEALVLVTEWHSYRRPDFPRLLRLMRTPVLIDGRNVWDPAELRELGFRYHGLGRRG